MLAWLAAHRASLVPLSTRPGALLLDLACGGGLLAPHLTGYRHVGLDLSPTAVRVASGHGVQTVQGDVTRLPFADACAQVVVAGEVLEHVCDPAALLTEAVRVLQPGGTLVLDTIADTALARFVSITLAERLPGGPPTGLHDGDLFVDRDELLLTCQGLGVDLTLRGLRPSAPGYLAWLARRRDTVRMVTTPLTSVLFTGVGIKRVGLGQAG